MKRFLTTLLKITMLGCLILMNPGCAKRNGPITTVPHPIHTFEDSNQPIHIQVGDIFNLSLDSNPTTGYQWEFGAPLDEKLIRLMKTQFQSKTSPIPLTGQGGKETWSFKALQKGETLIILHYLRPWENNKKPVQIKEFKIIIH